MKQFLGIDLGTSGVKLLVLSRNGVLAKAKCAYEAPTPTGWLSALKSAIKMLPPFENLGGIALSSQVGTYITDRNQVISWEATAGSEELPLVKSLISREEFLQSIGMDHPDLISYPLPRLLYIQKQYPQATKVCMPKELLTEALTGNCVSDVFSWRGLCHPEKGVYAQALLTRLGIALTLPPLAKPSDLAGCITESAAKEYGLPAGAPVYVGCNDFFAGLLGMGVWEKGSIFELSGTSEHLGVITDAPMPGAFVSGAYFNGCATYGGTKSSGVSCDFALKNFGIDDLDADILQNDPPIFLPYLNGERAPIYDPNARGVFFGIHPNTTCREMAYAVLEGVVFSLYHIGEHLPLAADKPMITGGGSAANALMATLKATLFNRAVLRVTENDSSAMGAALLAMVGAKECPAIADAMSLVTYETIAQPIAELRPILEKRFGVYKSLYPALKNSFSYLKEMSQ